MIKLGETPICVIDVESTGLSPSSDRIVEIAVLRLEEDWMSGVWWESLVNPERDPGPTHAHGLTTADLEHAPTFWDIAPELAEMLSGCVIAAHNVNFDAAFLRYEFWRLGKVFPRYPLLDTARVGTALGNIIKGDARSLQACCARAGIVVGDAHSARGDAMATGELLRQYLQAAYEQEMDFADLAVSQLLMPEAIAFPPRTTTKALARKQ